MKYVSNKEIFICIMLGLGLGFAGYIIPFFLHMIVESRGEPLLYGKVLFFFLYSLIILGPLVFWVVVPLVKVFKRRRQQ
jgi:hypothetical protein